MGDEKRFIEDRRYAILSPDTVRMFAESVGVSDLPDEVSNLLSEDVTYRLREVIQHSCHFLRHSRRKKLTAEDVNKALKNSDVPPIPGHGSPEVLPFRKTKEGELYFLEDLDINLPNRATSNNSVPSVSPHSLKAYWLAVEGIQKPATLPPNLHVDQAKIKAPPTIPEDLLTYYDNVTKAILGTDEEIMKMALVDLRTSAKISRLLPYFINFFANGVRTVNHDITQLTKLLHTVRALINNTSLNLEPKPYLELLVQGVLYCVIEPLAASINPINDHWRLRDYAARLLAKITRDWESPLNSLQEQNISSLQEVLYDLSRPFCSHYGAVMGLIAFGTPAIEEVLLPHLPSFWNHLVAVIEDTSPSNSLVKSDAQKVHGAILLAGEYVLKSHFSSILKLAAEGAPDIPTTPSPESSAMETETKTIKTDHIDQHTQIKQEPYHIKTEPDSPSVKPDVQLMETNDLIGPVINLPETTNPYKKLLLMYTQLYEYFGDSLAMKFCIKHVDNVYVVRRKEIQVTLQDAPESRKTGEELLQQFLTAAIESRAPLEHKDAGRRGERRSFDPTSEDMEYELEEKSERSSRSSRSHSDENLSYLGEDSDLTVKATVSDPSQGIKLTILKRPKIKLTSEDEDTDGKHDLEEESLPTQLPNTDQLTIPKLKKTSAPMNLNEVFDIEPIIENEVFFIFRFAGCEQVFNSKRYSRRMEPGEMVYQRSGTRTTQDFSKTYGQKNFLIKKKTKRRMPLHSYTGNIDMIL